MLTTVGEVEAGAGDEVGHRTRDEDLTRPTSGLHALSGVHGDAADVLTAQLDLSGVKARPDFDPNTTKRRDDSDGAANGACRPVEGGDEPVTCRVHFPTSEAFELASHHRVVGVQHLAPACITQLRGLLGRADDVGEQHGGQHPIGVVRAMCPSPTGTAP